VCFSGKISNHDTYPDGQLSTLFFIRFGLALEQQLSIIPVSQNAEFYLRFLCSVSEPLAAQQSNTPAIPNDIKIITNIKTTTF